jgi:hypothetical protein
MLEAESVSLPAYRKRIEFPYPDFAVFAVVKVFQRGSRANSRGAKQKCQSWEDILSIDL